MAEAADRHPVDGVRELVVLREGLRMGSHHLPNLDPCGIPSPAEDLEKDVSLGDDPFQLSILSDEDAAALRFIHLPNCLEDARLLFDHDRLPRLQP